MGKFNLATNGSGISAVGGWENVVASPYAQNKTVVVGLNDGGTGVMNNTVNVYVGNKTNTGLDVDKAGLTNGQLYFITVTGQPTEITNTTTSATSITNGSAFTLTTTSGTVFSRPEDGAWNPLNPAQFYFVTTDRLDQATLGLGSQIGRTRLWRLTFTDITNPTAGGTIDILAEGGVGNDATMWDNMCVTPDGLVFLQEDPGNTAHNAKVWLYNPATTSLTKVLKHDENRFGDNTRPATAPFNVDEESSGMIDVTDMLGGNIATGDRMFIIADQAHYTLANPLVQGGQLVLVNTVSPMNAWRQSNFGNVVGSGFTAPGADFDGDGITNLLEYALGLNPSVGTGVNGIDGLPTGSTTESDSLLSDRLTFSLTTDSPTPSDITLYVQSTTDLMSWTDVARKIGNGVWSWLPGGTPHIVSSAVGPRVNTKVGDNLPKAGNPHRMMRLSVTTP